MNLIVLLGAYMSLCQTRRVVKGIERNSGREVELVVKKKN